MAPTPTTPTNQLIPPTQPPQPICGGCVGGSCRIVGVVGVGLIVPFGRGGVRGNGGEAFDVH